MKRKGEERDALMRTVQTKTGMGRAWVRQHKVIVGRKDAGHLPVCHSLFQPSKTGTDIVKWEACTPITINDFSFSFFFFSSDVCRDSSGWSVAYYPSLFKEHFSKKSLSFQHSNYRSSAASC